MTVEIEKNISYFDSRYLKLDASNGPVTGDLLIKPTSNSTTTLQVQQSDGTDVLVVDTTNARVGVNVAPAFPLEVQLSNAETGNIQDVAAFKALSSASTGEGFGSGIKFTFEDDTAVERTLARISGVKTTAADNVSDLVIEAQQGGSLVEVMRFVGTSGRESLRLSYDGSASFAAFTWVSDNNTGMYRSGTDALSFTTGGTQRLTISSQGSVLIDGFTSSNVGLTVKAAASQSANLQEWQDSSGNVLSGVDERGILFSDGNSVDTNVFIGKDTGNVAATGGFNTVVGGVAGDAITSGSRNTCLGYDAGSKITTGIRNNFFGYSAGSNLTDGNYNVAIEE